MEEEFKKWLAKKPSDEVFDYNNGSNCALAQFTGGSASFHTVYYPGGNRQDLSPEFAQALRGGLSIQELEARSFPEGVARISSFYPVTFGEVKRALGMEP